MPWIGRWDNLKVGNRFELRDAMEAIFDDLDLGVELGLIVQLLKITTTAAAKIWTGGLDAISGGFENFDDRSKRNASFLMLDLYTQTITRR